MSTPTLPFPPRCNCRESLPPSGRRRSLTTAWWDGWVRYAADPGAWSRR